MGTPRVHENIDHLADTGQDRDTIGVVPNGISIDQIRNTPFPDEGDSFDTLFAGRLVADKNVSVLLDTFDRMADDHDDVALGVVGGGPETDRLERQADSLDHADHVSLLGFLDEYEDVLGQMRAVNMFVSPSTRKGLDITHAEAMAVDCTVIGVQRPESTASGVISDVGYLVELTVNLVTESLARALGDEAPPIEPTKRVEWYN